MLETHLLVEVDGSIVPAEPDLPPPRHAPDGHENLSLGLAVLPNIDVVLVRGRPGLDEVHAGDVRLPVRVHDDDVVVLAQLWSAHSPSEKPQFWSSLRKLSTPVIWLLVALRKNFSTSASTRPTVGELKLGTKPQDKKFNRLNKKLPSPP